MHPVTLTIGQCGYRARIPDVAFSGAASIHSAAHAYLTLLSRGQTNKLIARQLGISDNTVWRQELGR